MRRNPIKDGLQLLACLILVVLTTANASTPSPLLPNPVLFFTGQEPYQASGKQWIRYKYQVDNFAAYPNELFAAAPALPPCGANTNASRAWVDIFDQSGKRLNGFCALGTPQGLNKLWFAMEPDVIPPSWIYIEINDRQTSTKYKSNLAESVL